MSTLSQIGFSGVRAAQVSLSTTGQNIANVNTPGFSRLQTISVSMSGTSALSAGGGVQVSSIRRLSNDFQNQQLWRATTEQNYYSSAQQYLTALEGLMAGDGSSISVGLDRFFAALSEASATPGSAALRQQIISEASNLSQRFNGLNQNIQAQIDALHEQRVAMVTEINGLSANIAELNRRITETESVQGDSSALRDQRDSLLQAISQYASLRINETADGSVTVALANGQPLVAGPTAGQMEVTLPMPPEVAPIRVFRVVLMSTVKVSELLAPIWKTTPAAVAPNLPASPSILPSSAANRLAPAYLVLATMLYSSLASSSYSDCRAVRSSALLVSLAAWVARSFMRWTMSVISWKAPSAVCSRETASLVLRMATSIPRDWAFRRVAICRPAASSAALLMR